MRLCVYLCFYSVWLHLLRNKLYIYIHISAKCAYSIFLRINWHFRRHFKNIICVSMGISIRFRYLDHLVVNKMAPSMCPDPCGTRWSSWFQAILYHISAYFCRIFGIYAVRVFLMPHKTDTPSLYSGAVASTRVEGWGDEPCEPTVRLPD